MTSTTRDEKLFPNRRQPWKALYLGYSISSLIVRIPAWIIASLLPPFKQHSSWTFKKAFILRVARFLISVRNSVGDFLELPDARSINKKLPSNATGTWIDPVPLDRIPSDIRAFADTAKVSPLRIPGYWYHRPELHSKPIPNKIDSLKAKEGENIGLFIHGGGFVFETAHPSYTNLPNIPRQILKSAPRLSRVLAVEYRLSTGPPLVKSANPFPAALIDVISAYDHLVHTLNFPPENITIFGDSAGGNLALALTRATLTSPELGLLKPARLLLLSPWVDLGSSHEGLGTSLTTNIPTDFVNGYINGDYAQRLYLAPFEEGFADSNPYVSPASKKLSIPPTSGPGGLFKDFPRTMITAGAQEELVDQIRTLRDKMVGDLGEGSEGVTYYEAESGFHDTLCFPWAQPEFTTMSAMIGKWFAEE